MVSDQNQIPYCHFSPNLLTLSLFRVDFSGLPKDKRVTQSSHNDKTRRSYTLSKEY